MSVPGTAPEHVVSLLSDTPPGPRLSSVPLGLLLAENTPSGYSLTMKTTLGLPERAFSSLLQAPDDFAAQLRLAAGVKWYEWGRISPAKAAEISSLSRAAFIVALRACHGPAIHGYAKAV